MANYAKMARDAARRRKSLVKDLARAKKDVRECESELAVLEQILSALKGVDAGGRPGKGGRKGGKWRPGRPGRPPKWYVEQQKAKGKGKGKGKRGKPGRKKRRGRKPGRRPAARPATPAPAAAAPAPPTT